MALRLKEHVTPGRKWGERKVNKIGGANAGNWAQEHYNARSGDARIRAAHLRRIGYDTKIADLGSQVTPYGKMRLSTVNIRPGLHSDTYDLPETGANKEVGLPSHGRTIKNNLDEALNLFRNPVREAMKLKPIAEVVREEDASTGISPVKAAMGMSMRQRKMKECPHCGETCSGNHKREGGPGSGRITTGRQEVPVPKRQPRPHVPIDYGSVPPKGAAPQAVGERKPYLVISRGMRQRVSPEELKAMSQKKIAERHAKRIRASKIA